MAPKDRGPSKDDNSRMNDIRNKQQSPSGDPRQTGQLGGSRDSPLWIRSAETSGHDPVGGFFDSFTAPNAQQGPQRPQEQHGHGEEAFRAVITSQQALASAAKQVADELRTAAHMATQFTVDASAYGRQLREQRATESERMDRVLKRLEEVYGGSGDGDRPKSGKHTGIPDLDNPRPDGSYPHVRHSPMAAPPTPPAGPTLPPGGGGGGGGGGSGPPGGSGGSGGGSGPQGGSHRSPGGSPDPQTRLRHHEAVYLQQQHMGNLRKQMQRQLQTQTAESYHQQFGMGTDNKPTPIKTTDANGDTVYQLHGANGQIGPDIDEATANSMGLITKARNAAFVSRVAGGFARGGAKGAGTAAVGGALAGAAGGAGAMGAIAKVGMKAVPFVGTALAVADAAKQTLEFAGEQRAKNSFYQSIQGGTNFSGFGDRLREEGFVWGEKLTTGLGDEDARKAFKGVSQTGYTGANRDQATDMISRLYKDVGMNVEQSLQAISIASAGAQTNFSGLATSLRSVSAKAKETGQNAETMRDKFIQTYGVVMKSAASANSQNVAEALTNAGPGQGREYAGVDLSGVTSESNTRLLAAKMGISYAQLMGQKARGNDKGWMDASTKMIQDAAKRMMNPQNQQTLDQMTQEAGGDLSKVDAQELGNRFMDQGMDPGVAKQILQSYGVDTSKLPETEVVPYLAKIITGQANAGGELDKEQEKNNIRDLKGEDRTGGAFGGAPWQGPESNTGTSKFVDEHSRSPAAGALSGLGWVPLIGPTLAGLGNTSSVSESTDAATGAYSDRQEETGKVEPAIEAMIDQLSGDENTGITVQTSDGEKTVSVEDAVKYYGDQVNRGTAKVVSNDENDGKTVGEVTGVKSDNVEGPDTSKEEEKGGGFSWESLDPTSDKFGWDGGKGVSAEDWKKDHGGDKDEDSGSGDGKIKIEATDELRRFLKISGSGSVSDEQVDSGAKDGVPPKAEGNVPE